MMCIVVKSIDYDLDLDFLENLPKTPVKPVSADGRDDGALQQNTSLQCPTQPQFTDEVDFLITPDRAGMAAADRSVKVPSIDRSTKPSSAVLNNSVADSPVSSGQPAASTTRISDKLTSDKNADLPANISTDSRSLTKPDTNTVDISTRSNVPPVAPDRSTKPILPATSSSDMNAHSARLKKEQAELNIIQAKKMQEANDVANLMREKRKLEKELEKNKQLIDSHSGTK